jgi:hypothetical protein
MDRLFLEWRTTGLKDPEAAGTRRALAQFTIITLALSPTGWWGQLPIFLMLAYNVVQNQMAETYLRVTGTQLTTEGLLPLNAVELA